MAVIPRSCERARSLASLALDDELSELEGRLLRRHVSRCPACAAFQADATAFTGLLREAPLESMPAPVAVRHHRHRRSGQHLVRVSASVAAVLVVLGGTAQLVRLPARSPGDESLAAPVPRPTEAQLLNERLNWPGGLPSVKPSELPAQLGQRPGVDPNQP